MAAGLKAVLRRLRDVAAAEGDQQSDRQLVERFAAHGDESAFAALVRRHAEMVLSVCRRVLHNDTDADDACQATFLILLRKAVSIRKKDSLASWLHGVAHRAAANLRKQASRRRGREERAAAARGEPANASWHELQGVLDEEIARLPEQLRGPIVLCYLEGKAHDEGAKQLGWSLTTFRGRLTARKLLRSRLTRRGITLSGALLVADLAGNAAASAAYRAGLVKTALTSEATARVTALSQRVVVAMLLNRLRIGVMTVLLGALAVVVCGVLLGSFARSEPNRAHDGANVDGEEKKLDPGAKEVEKAQPETDGQPRLRDVHTMFDIYSRGQPFFLVTKQKRIQEPLTQFLKERGIDNGQVTRELFVAFMKPRPADKADPLTSTTLIATTLRDQSREAFLHMCFDRDTISRVKSKPGSGFEWIGIRSEDWKKVLIEAEVLRIDGARIFFRQDDLIYSLGLGESLQTALTRGPTKLPEAEPFVPPGGRIVWVMHQAPWQFVFESVANELGVTFRADAGPPNGTFTGPDPSKLPGPATHSAQEILDVVAARLAIDGYQLILQGKSLRLGKDAPKPAQP